MATLKTNKDFFWGSFITIFGNKNNSVVVDTLLSFGGLFFLAMGRQFAVNGNESPP